MSSLSQKDRSTWKVPEKARVDGLEEKWSTLWEQANTYQFDASATREDVYSIDTPPPTVSGRLHIGHACSYTHTDVIARYQRMKGREVFYPMGWDNNSLNVERRAQLTYGIICDPTLPYNPDFTPPQKPGKRPIPVSRRNFIEQCGILTEELQQTYRHLWTLLGLSVDWDRTYTTMSEDTRRTSQQAFLRLVSEGVAYQALAPTLWDVDMRTAIAQAELEDRELEGHYHKLRFVGVDTEDFVIDTTRPELLASCVALVVNPEDSRYQAALGKTVRTPLFGVEVPVVAHHLADPEKGTGAAMICTFGDVTDVIWWRELQLPIRTTIGRDGRIVADPPEGVARSEAWEAIAGLRIKAARKAIVEQLATSGDLVEEPRRITHPVKFWENGDQPLEIVTSDQWFIRIPTKSILHSRGGEIAWHPNHMRQRYDDWTNGLLGDWNITRQRFYSVPFPVWYHADASGAPDRERPIFADEAALPVDPLADAPPGFTADQRNAPGGFVGDHDVMDTWATSSLTPQIACGWQRDPTLYAATFPMDLRPQAHEIIRTWLFYTVVRNHYLEGTTPWKHTAISGFVVDPDRKKLSKSKGNAPDDPELLLAKHGADGLRYWAANGKLGIDINFDEGQMKVGRRLATKLLNASKFVLALEGPAETPTLAIDQSQLAKMAHVIAAATEAFDRYEYAQALALTESAFWDFCDDYIELVKVRAYEPSPEGASARGALRASLEVFQQLFAPVLPYATEESWSWWHEGSVHLSPWPTRSQLGVTSDELDTLRVAAFVLGEIRKTKSAAKVSMKTEVAKTLVTGSSADLDRVLAVAQDLRQAGHIEHLETAAGDELQVDVTLSLP